MYGSEAETEILPIRFFGIFLVFFRVSEPAEWVLLC